MKKENFIRVIAFIPAIAIMTCIFLFSSQDSVESSELSNSVTYNLVSGIDNIFHFISDNQKLITIVENLEGFIRKMGHFTEYAILSISVILPLYFYNIRNKSINLITLTICVLYAASDELHQLFVPGRYGCIKDVCIDSAGALLGIIVINLSKKK